MRTISTIIIIFLTMSAFCQTEMPIPTENRKEFHYCLFRFASQGEIDSVKLILENYSVDLCFHEKNSSPVIFAAARSGNTELIRYLIEKGANPVFKNTQNETALHHAAWSGNLDAVKLLVDYGVDVNIIYAANGGLSPLCCAAESGNIDVVKYLIDKGAEVNYEADSGSSPLRSAAYSAHYDVFMLLAQQQANPYNWQEALFYGLIGGNVDIVKYIVEKRGADVNQKSTIWDVYPIEKGADYYPFKEKAQPVEVMKYLLSKGARLSDIDNGNVFKWAMENSSDETIIYLMEKGVEITIPMVGGWTPLTIALDENRFVLAKYLLKKTPKNVAFKATTPLIVFFADGEKDSPQIIDLLIKGGFNKAHYTQAFLQSVACDDSLSVRLLLDAGANIKALHPDRSNVLRFVKSQTLADFLIKQGADTQNVVMLENAWENTTLLQVLDQKNITPPISQTNMGKVLLNAAKLGDVWTIEYLLRRGVQVNYVDETDVSKNEQVNKQTALIKNAIQGYSSCSDNNNNSDKVQVPLHITEILLNAGADPNIADSDGRTALHYVAGKQECGIEIGSSYVGTRRLQWGHGDPTIPPPQYHDSFACLLLKNGANVDIQDKDGNTPLLVAAMFRNYTVMKVLLEAKANTTLRNKKGKNVFEYIDDQASLQIMKDAGYWHQVSEKTINAAFVKFFTNICSEEPDVDKLKALISYGANVNSKLFDYGTNALELTFNYNCVKNKFEIAQVLIDAGINLNNEDLGYTIAMQMIQENKYNTEYYKNCLDFLVKNKVDLNYKCKNQLTALSIAICENKKELVDYLEQHGAKRDRQSEWWYLIRGHLSASRKIQIQMLQQLTMEGIDVNLQFPVDLYAQEQGMTGLMFYIERDKEEEVSALLKMGANVHLKAAYGATALAIAKARENQKIIEWLIQAGATE